MKIDIYPDGDQITAIIGSMPEALAIGIGGTIFEALEELYEDMAAKKRCARCFSDKIDIENGMYKCECGHFEDNPKWDEE
ncbi:MAG: hypothetical protein WC124_02205 [Desulfoplanes sp.]